MAVRLIVEADGGSRGNPGPAGYGALVRDADSGQILARRNGFLGRVSNNVAEYRGLIAGLQAVAEIDAGAQVEVRMDSKLVVEQMSGRWKIRHPDMVPLAREAAVLADALAPVRFTWIPRAQNVDADRLANEAMDARHATFDALDDTGRDATGRPAAGDETAPATGEGTEQGDGWRDPPAVDTTSLVLLRHGQTSMSIEKRFCGSSDPPLTGLGRRQAAAAAESLAATGGFDAIITSPKARARATAEAAGQVLGLTPHVDDAWRECDFGEFEGLTFAEARQRFGPQLRAWLADPAAPPPGGESFDEVTVRVAAARDLLVSGATAGKRILVVSHVSPIKVIARLALEAPPSALQVLYLDLASISRIDLRPGERAVLRGWNDTGHLTGS